MAHAPLHDPLADPQAQAAHEVRKATCCMCACRCGIRVHLRGGQVRCIDGNPGHPLNQGAIRAKGSSGIMKQYSPARLTRPLERREGAERGAGGFVQIEWEEAFATPAARLAKIRATDPKQFALFGGPNPDLDRAKLFAMIGTAATLLAAFGAQYLGRLAERWFFFAQARHPQNLHDQAVA